MGEVGRHVWDGVVDLLAGTAGIIHSHFIFEQDHCTSGVACVYAGQPLDTVKVKMQTFSSLYTNSMACLVETGRKEGIRGLYAGTVPALAANVAENAILFCAYGFCQKTLAKMVHKPVDCLGPIENAVAGSGAAVFSSFALCPTELIKCRLQAMREMKQTHTGSLGASEATVHGPLSLTREILRTDGFRGLFRGLVPTFAREVPGYFFFFGGYEMSRGALTPPGKTKDEIGLWRTALSGGVGGVSLWVAIFPADVIKSQVQVQGGGSFLPVAREILAKDGLRGLYKGLGPTIIRSFFATGVLFVAFEWTKKTLHSFD